MSIATRILCVEADLVAQRESSGERVPFKAIGIILCTDKDDVAAEYVLGRLSNQIFASRYVLHMPDKEQLIAQVEDVLNKWHNK